MDSERKYFAFISYSRKDKEIAEWLQKKIEHFRYPKTLVLDRNRPSHSKYVRRIFLDRNELEISHEDFQKDITFALKNSRYLILLCSKNSSQSPWVRAELEDFLEHNDYDYSLVVPVILDGDNINDIFSGHFEFFKDAFGSRNLPDLRIGKDEDKTHALESGLIKILAYILKVPHNKISDRFNAQKTRIFKFILFWFFLASTIASLLIYLLLETQESAVEMGEQVKTTEIEIKEISKKFEEKVSELKDIKKTADETLQELENLKLAKQAAKEKLEKEKKELELKQMELAIAAKIAEEKAKADFEVKRLEEERKSKEELENKRKKYEEELFNTQKLFEILKKTNGDILIKQFSRNPIFEDTSLDYYIWRSLSVFGGNIALQDIARKHKLAISKGNSDEQFLNELSLNLKTAWNFKKGESLDPDEIRKSIMRGLPVIVFLQPSEGLYLMQARSEKREDFSHLEEWISYINQGKISAGKKNNKEAAALIYGYNYQSDEFFFNFDKRFYSILGSELSSFLSSAFFAQTTKEEQEALIKNSQQSAFSKGEFPQFFQKFLKVKAGGGKYLDCNFPALEEYNSNPEEVIFEVYDYLGCNPSLEKLSAFANIQSSSNSVFENAGKNFSLNWHFENWNSLPVKNLEDSINMGLPVIVKFKSFKEELSVWANILKTRQVNPEKIQLVKYELLPLEKFEFFVGKKYAIICGYNKSKQEYLLYMDGKYFILTYLEAKVLTEISYIPYFKKSLDLSVKK